MISVVGRSTQFAPAFKASVQSVAIIQRPIVASVAYPIEEVIHNPKKTDIINTYSMAKLLPTGFMKAKTGLTSSFQIRNAHTDIKVPSYEAYRYKKTQEPSSRNRDSIDSRNSYSYLVTGTMTVAGLYAAKNVVTTFVGYMGARSDMLALTEVEIKMSDIPEGKSMTFKWRGKPLFIKHRTEAQIAQEKSVDISTLRDPQHDSERVVEDKWLVVIGVCTHLGCVPIADAGDWGGYYCPCHGSHYDSSGRIRKGPAPSNLEVPPTRFEGDLIIVG